MLVPGFSIAFHATTLNRSRASIVTYRSEALKAAQSNPMIAEAVDTAIWAIRPEDALQMAQLRGRTQLPHWSRLAIGDYRKRGFSRRMIADAFRCSQNTVANVLQGKGRGYAMFSGERRLTEPQQNPPNRWNEANPRAKSVIKMVLAQSF